jgi:hypothetical protein
MKIIERPDSTTIEMTYSYHVIRDAREAKNVLEGVTTPDRIVRMHQIVDKDTFQPQIAFILRNTDENARNYGLNMFFVSNIEHLMDADKGHLFFWSHNEEKK